MDRRPSRHPSLPFAAHRTLVAVSGFVALSIALGTPSAISAVAAEATAASQAGGEALTLTVVLDGLTSDAGTAAVALYDSPAAFQALAEPVRKARLEIVDRRCTWTVEGLPPGNYAVTAYHDLDGDGELDKGAFGIPSEPYGFSNGARGKLGPPTWKAVRVSLTGDTRLRIPLR